MPRFLRFCLRQLAQIASSTGVHELLEYILEIPDNTADFELKATKMIYKTCLEIPFYGRMEPEIIANHVKRIRRKYKKPWDIHNAYLKLTGESALFDFMIFLNELDEPLPLLLLSDVSSAYGSIFHGHTWKPAEERNYENYLYHVMRQLGLEKTDEILHKKIANVMKFRQELNEVSLDATIMGPDPIDTMAPSEIARWFEFHVCQSDRSKKIMRVPWLKIAKIMLPRLPNSVLINKGIFAIKSKYYFKKLIGILCRATEADIVSHMEVYFIEKHLMHTRFMIKLLQQTSLEPYEYASVVQQDVPRWHKCLQENNIEPFLVKLYVQKWYKKENKQMVTDIIDQVKSSIKKQVRESLWLNFKIKEEVIKRLDKIEYWIGEPPWVGNSSIPKGEPIIGETLPNAFLNFDDQVLYIHAAIMKTPMFHPKLPRLYNFASMGFLVGHELYHLIYDCGSYGSPPYDRTWWPEDMKSQCVERKKCFISEYNRITYQEFRKRYNKFPSNVDTEKSVLENYADVMGLEAAYYAYLKYTDPERKGCYTLPGFAGYSCDQMFFIAFANVFCGNPTAKAAWLFLSDGSHSINSVRVNGAVSNTQAFTNAFDCQKGDIMNPRTKCNLWI